MPWQATLENVACAHTCLGIYNDGIAKALQEGIELIRATTGALTLVTKKDKRFLRRDGGIGLCHSELEILINKKQTSRS